MTIFLLIIWLVFVGYWQFSSHLAKTDAGKPHQNILYYIKIRYVLLIVLFFQAIPKSGNFLLQSYKPNSIVLIMGITLTIVGVSFALWARYYLGTNWSSKPSLKINQELITSGPYRMSRHPIYGGILSGLVGSIIVGVHLWAVVLIFFLPLYIFKISTEEKMMLKKFPKEYPQYQKRTKIIFPYII